MFKQLMLSVFMVCGLTTLHAQSLVGGQIKTSLISSSKVVVQVAYYRDCRGTGLKSSSVVYGCFVGNSGGNSCGSKTLTAPAFKSFDITYLGVGKNPPCSPNSTGTAAGWEQVYFNDTVDLNSTGIATLLNSSTCTELTFYANYGFRTAAFDNGSASTNFYMMSTLFLQNIKKCKLKTNYAPDLLFPPSIKITEAELQSFTAAPLDSVDNDLIRCSLVNPYTNTPNSQITLKSPYVLGKPLPTYCGTGGTGFCAPNSVASPIRGFNFDTITGKMLYIPDYVNTLGMTSNSNTVFQVLEYRLDTLGNWQLIGKTMREVPFMPQPNSTTNNPPSIQNVGALEAIAGVPFYKEIKISDVQKLGQIAADTVQVKAVSGCKPLKMSIKNPKDREKIVVISGTADSSWISKVPYRMSILASDRYNSPVAMASDQFLITVKPLGKYSVTLKMGQCNRVLFKVTLDKKVTGTNTFTWFVTDVATKTMEYSSTKQEDSSTTLTPGKKYITLQIKGDVFGFATYTDSIIASYKAQFTVVGKTTLCKESPLSLKATPVTMKKIASVTYVNGSNSFKDTLNNFTKWTANASFSMTVTATDILGCSASQSVNIVALELPQPLSVHQLNTCQNAPDLDLFASFTPSKNRSYLFSSFGGYVLSNRYFKTSNIPSQEFLTNAFSSKKVMATITDSNSCVRPDSLTIKVFALPKIGLSQPSLCQNTLKTNLDNYVLKPNLGGVWHNWSVVNCPKSVNASQILMGVSDTIKRDFFFGSSTFDTTAAGQYKFGLWVKDTSTGCLAKDTLTVKILNEPMLSLSSSTNFCANASAVDLFRLIEMNGDTVKSGYCKLLEYNHTTMNVVLYNTALLGKRYFPKNGAVGNWTYKFVGPLTGCADTMVASFDIVPTPVAAFSLNKDTLIDVLTPQLQATNNSSISNNQTMNYEWIPGTGNSADNQFTTHFNFTYPSLPKRYLLKLIATSTSYNCADTFGKYITFKPNVGIDNLRCFGGHFSPNGQVLGLSETIRQINWYNLSGQLLFTDVNNQGNNLPTGVYIYEIIVNSQDKIETITGKWER